MARPLRIELSGGVYHVTSRGDRREDIFFCDEDRLAWLEIFGQVCERYHWRCHAWCQMTNHYHVVIETPEGNLAQGMRQLNGVFTQYINRTHQRVGHVFQGRYKSILVEKDSYLLELARYVVLNPLRACMVKGLGDWAWSSYRAMTGDASPPPWLETGWILGQFGSDENLARRRYTDFVRAGVGLPSVWDDLKNQIFLGSDRFVAQMQTAIPLEKRLEEVPRMQRRAIAEPLQDYRLKFVHDPALGMALAFMSGDYTMKAIAGEFGVHYTTVSRAVKRYESMSMGSRS
jgi:REP element-mobilizing transposase RayT